MNGLITQAQISHRPPSRRSSHPRSIAIVFAAALLALFASGCGQKSTTGSSSTTSSSGTSSSSSSPATSSTPGASASPQASQLLQDCSKATTALHSVHVVLATDNLTTLPFDSVDADVTNQPQEQGGRAVGTANVRLGKNPTPVMKAFLVTNKTMYTKDDAGVYTSVGPAEKIYDPGIILAKDKGLGFAIGKIQGAQTAGNETINGVATVKLTGTIDAATIDPIIPQIGKGGGTLPITLYITDVNAAGAPPGGTPNLVRMVVDKDQGHVTATLSAWGQPVNIPNPPS
ncbi:MAG: LppX_LprAFG lipoprotein [Mycobacterium sp.]